MLGRTCDPVGACQGLTYCHTHDPPDCGVAGCENGASDLVGLNRDDGVVCEDHGYLILLSPEERDRCQVK